MALNKRKSVSRHGAGMDEIDTHGFLKGRKTKKNITILCFVDIVLH